MKIYWIDLFCGAGGTTTGIHLSGSGQVIACVNHNKMAIESHRSNHPGCIHYTEDITTLDIGPLVELVSELRNTEPDCVVNLWASLECTNFSNAKGGAPRDADSRTLANHLFRYIDGINPDFIFIENVREFMAWGPLDKNGKPESRTKGVDYIRWVNNIENRGYSYSYRLLNSADFGAYTSRTRYFGQFALSSRFSTSWPKPTHAKNPKKSNLFDQGLKRWKQVRDVLELDDEGQSIFNRKKPLVDGTMKRIYAGLVKFVGERQFIQKSFSGAPQHKVISLNRPAGTVKTKDGQYLVSSSFLATYYGKSGISSLDRPAPTVTTKDRITNVSYLMADYGNGHNIRQLDKPAYSVVSSDKHRFITARPFIMDTQFNNTGQDVDRPMGVVTANRKHHYLINPQWFGLFRSIDRPSFTLIARMDKAPPYLISFEDTAVARIEINKYDSRWTKRVKGYMIRNCIVDIKMRLLHINELKRIQGFPEDYELKGSKTLQKKFLGNAVEVNTAKAIARNNAEQLMVVSLYQTA